MTLRARLILLVISVLTITMSGFAWLLVRTERHELVRQVGDRVTSAAARDAGAPPLIRLPGTAARPRPRTIPAPLSTDASSGTAGNPGGRQVATLLFAPDGTRLLADAAGFADRPDPLPELPAIGSAAQRHMVDRLTTVSSVDGSMRYLVMTRDVSDGNVRFDAGSLAGVDDAVSGLVRMAAVAGLFALVLASVISVLVLRRNFRPVDRMVSTAAAIAAGDLSARVPHEAPQTELGRLGTSLNTMLNTIEHAVAERDLKERELRQFVADASHELRTPLTAVRGYTDLYRSGALARPEELERAMSRIDGQATRMARLVDDLLLLANLDRVDFLRREPVDVRSIVAESAADFRAADSNHPITVVAPHEAPARVDADRVRQIVDNLLENVRVHTDAGTPVSVAVTADGDAVTIEVVDGGPGIDPEDRDRLFDRFWRADPSRARKTGGSGLGLSIVSSIVAAHGGTISVDAPPEGGAAFRVSLPVREHPAG